MHAHKRGEDASQKVIQATGPALGSVAKDHRKMATVRLSNKGMAEHISRWNAQQLLVDDDTSVGSLQIENASETQQNDANLKFDYIDETKKACLLCQRQFKTLEVLHRHSKESELHQKNLKDEAICEAGRQRKREGGVERAVKSEMMKPAGFAPVKEAASSSAAQGEASASDYRDRAQERRIVFGTERNWKPGQGKRKAIDAPQRKIEEERPSGKSTFNASTGIGSDLLARMGWTAGQGFGHQRSGRTDPVEARVFAPGAGIGSQVRTSTPLTVEQHSARQTRFVLGNSADRRHEQMYDRFREGGDNDDPNHDKKI